MIYFISLQLYREREAGVQAGINSVQQASSEEEGAGVRVTDGRGLINMRSLYLADRGKDELQINFYYQCN